MYQERSRRTLLEVARSLSIRCTTAQQFLEARGVSGYEPDSPVPQSIADMLAKEFRPQRSMGERLLERARRALGSLSRAENRLRKLALSLRGPQGPSAGVEQDEGTLDHSPTVPTSEGEETREQTESMFPGDLPAEEGGLTQAEQDRQEPRQAQPAEGEERVFDELDNLEELLSRMSGGKGWMADLGEDDLSGAPRPEETERRERPGPEDGGEGSWERSAGESFASGDEEDPFTLLERDIEEKTREEFLDESLKELEALLSELGTETVPGEVEGDQVHEEAGFEAEEISETGLPLKEDSVPWEVRGAEVHEEIGGGGEAAEDEGEDEDVRRTAPGQVESVGEEVSLTEDIGLKGEPDEPESLVSELLDLSALLREMPDLEVEPAEAEAEAPERPGGGVQPVAAPPLASLPHRESIRKWLRRSAVPQARSAAVSMRLAFRGLAPAQRRILMGFAAAVCLAILAAVGWIYWTHRPGGDIGLWRSGQELLSAGYPGPARKEFTKLVQRYPESPYLRRAMYLLGECLYQQGSYAAALNTFLRVKKLLASRPREIDGLLYPDFTFRDQGDLRIAECYVQEGRFDEGISIYEEIIARDEHAPVARTAALARSQAFLAWGDREGSAPAYRRAAQAFTLYREKYPTEEGWAWVHWRTALAYLGLSRTDRENARDHLVSAAVELEEARERQSEIEGWSSLSRSEMSLDLAGTYFELSHWPEAIREYDRLLASDYPPGIGMRAKLGRAKALFEAGEFARAFDEAREVAEKTRGRAMRAEALFTSGDAAWELRRYEEMLAAYEEALSITGGEDLAPRYAERAHMRITNVLFVQEKNYEEAAERYQKIVSRYPSGPYTQLALYRQGCSLLELERYDESAAAFKRSIRDYPQFEHRDPELLVDAYYKAAECYMLTGSWEEAIEALKAALHDLGFPEDQRGLQARVDLASCYAALSLYDRAIAILRSYLERFPESDPDGEVSMRLAEYHRARFDFASARRIHERVAREHTGKPVALDALFAVGKDLLAQAAFADPGEKEALRSAALLRFEKVIQATPEDPAPVLEVARVYHGEGEFSAARVYLGRYFELSPEGPEAGEARFLAGESAYHLGAYREAIDHFGGLEWSGLAEAVIAQASFEQADAYRKLGDVERARALFHDTARLFPSTEWGKEARWQLDHLAWQERLVQRPVQ